MTKINGKAQTKETKLNAADNIIRFSEILYRESASIFKTMINEHKHQKIYVIGFYHSGGWDAIWPVFNTLESIEHPALEQMTEDEFVYYCNTKWNPYDFPSVEDYADILPDSENAFRTIGDALPFNIKSADMQAIWQETLRAIESTLFNLSKSGIFNDISDAILYVATHDEGFDDRFNCIQRINNNACVKPLHIEFERIIKIHQQWRDDAIQEIYGSN